jgi:hypothetical protein
MRLSQSLGYGPCKEQSRATGRRRQLQTTRYRAKHGAFLKHYRLSPLRYLAAFGLSFISDVVGIASCIMLAFFSLSRFGQ